MQMEKVLEEAANSSVLREGEIQFDTYNATVRGSHYLKNRLPDGHQVVVFLSNAQQLRDGRHKLYPELEVRGGDHVPIEGLTQVWCCCSCWCSSVSSTQGRSKLNQRDSVIRGNREGNSVDMSVARRETTINTM